VPAQPLILRLLLLLTPLLGACGTSKSEREDAPLMSQTMQQRFASARQRMKDPNDRSRFDPGVQSTLARQGGSGKALSGKTYRASEFADAKTYGHTPAYSAGTWTGADRDSGLADQSYARGEETAAGTGTVFQADASPLGNLASPADGKVFAGAGDEFSTRPNRDALRSQQKNQRPQVIQLEEQRRNPAYSEEQVRRLLGRP